MKKRVELNQIETLGSGLFANEPELLSPEDTAKLLGLSLQTIYDWRYRQAMRGIPKGMFLKISRKLYIRTSILRRWIEDQNVVV